MRVVPNKMHMIIDMDPLVQLNMPSYMMMPMDMSCDVNNADCKLDAINRVIEFPPSFCTLMFYVPRCEAQKSNIMQRRESLSIVKIQNIYEQHLETIPNDNKTNCFVTTGSC